MNRDQRTILPIFSVLFLALLAGMLCSPALPASAQFPTLPVEIPSGIPSALPTIPTAVPTKIVLPTLPAMCDAWRIEIDLPASMAGVPVGGLASGAQQIKNDILSGIEIENSPISVEVGSVETADGGLYTIVIEGVTVDLLQQALFVWLKPTLDVLGMPMMLTLTGQAQAGDIVHFLLTVIASTGSSWQLDDLDDVDKEIESLIECSHVAPGSPQNQNLDVKILEDGKVALKLLYKRAWEEMKENFPIRITLNA